MQPHRRAVGVLVKSTDVVTEGDLAFLCPSPMRLHHTRMEINPGESFEDMRGRLEIACAQIKHARPEVVVFACASGTFAGGEALNRQVSESIEKLTGCRALTTATAMTDAVRRVGMRRILLVSPYSDAVDDAIRQVFANVQVEVASVFSLRPKEIFQAKFMEHFGGTGNRLIDPAWLPELIGGALKKTSGVDGIVIACTGLRVSEALAALEQDTGLPVVAANQATAAGVQRLLGLRVPIAGFGGLLERPA